MNVTNRNRGNRIIACCREIAACTDVVGETTRTFLSPQMHAVHSLLRTWMEAAGMAVEIDAIGNLRGVHHGTTPDCPRLIIASHLDTVPNAGAFDGVLGVVLGLAVIEELHGIRLPFAIELIGFSEEEGVRFSKPFLGSLALAGKFDASILLLKDAHGISVEQSIRDFGIDPTAISAAKLSPATFAYLEFHIEQGPVLESADRPLGIVDAIVGQTRLLATFTGKANHAGTTPMRLRHDAMAAAAEWIVAVERIAHERDGLVATVGRVEIHAAAGNVIAGSVDATLDVRHEVDAKRHAALHEILDQAQHSAQLRGVQFNSTITLDQAAVPMDTRLTKSLDAAVKYAGMHPLHMVSGAGHDAMILAPTVPSCMLFLRTPKGLSHHPDESVLPEDVEAALVAGLEFIKLLSEDPTLVEPEVEGR